MDKENKSWGGLVLGGMMIALASFLVGGYGGSQLTATFLVSQNLNKDARDVQSQVMALRHLQAGDIPQAVELMESRLNHDLILFDPQEPYEGLSEQTLTNIEKAIKQAKAYRQEYPRNSNRRHSADEMVDNLFEKTN